MAELFGQFAPPLTRSSVVPLTVGLHDGGELFGVIGLEVWASATENPFEIVSMAFT